MAVLTVSDVLEMPALRTARAEVLAGTAGLAHQVRWVHSGELSDIASLLRGGDLLLSTGIALPESDEELRAFAASLADSGAAGLVLELGRRWQSLPAALIEACRSLDLPLISLASEVRFATVAQAVGERIVDEQLEELREAQRVHDTFTELSIAEAGPGDILDAVRHLAGSAVVLEGEDHQVLDYRSGPGDITDFLAGWTVRSRGTTLEGRTGWDRTQGWLMTRLGRRERRWGRLVVQSPAPPPQRLVAVAERAAAALALHRLHDRHRDGLVRRTHHELLLALLNDPSDAEVRRRCELAGLPTERRQLVGLAIRPRVEPGVRPGSAGHAAEEIIATTVRAAHELGAPALVCQIEQDVRVLLSFSRTASCAADVDELAARVGRRHRVLIAAGRTAAHLSEADRTLKDGAHILQSVRSDAAGHHVHRLENVHLRGLLTLLRDDERLTMFADRELAPILGQTQSRAAELVAALRALLEHPGSKSEAAASLHVSRPVLYDRLAKAERLLGVSLDDPDIRVSLHVALLIREAQAGG